MGHRLTKIYTKTGDNGTTGLADGSRVLKDDIVCEAMGNIDELNSALGLLLSQSLPEQDKVFLTKIQHQLFEVGAEISSPDYCKITAEDTRQIENNIDRLNANLPPLKEFILPNGHFTTTLCHLARSICRRAERSLVAFQQDADTNLESLKLINRLSDYLFVLARSLNEMKEEMWQHERPKNL